MSDNVLSQFKQAEEAVKPADTGRKLRIGIIGTGGISWCHFYNYLKMPDVEIVAIADLIPERAIERKEQFGLEIDKKKLQIGRVFAAQLLVKVFVNILLNTLWLNMLYGKAFLAILPGRLVSNAVMLPIDTAIMFFMLQAVDRTIRRYFDDNQ